MNSVEAAVRKAVDAVFRESDHPRDKDGRFGSGGGVGLSQMEREVTDELIELCITSSGDPGTTPQDLEKDKSLRLVDKEDLLKGGMRSVEAEEVWKSLQEKGIISKDSKGKYFLEPKAWEGKSRADSIVIIARVAARIAVDGVLRKVSR
jgi:hypothetical protein